MTGDDLISRAAACDEIGKRIHEYREKGDHDLADALILTRRYALKRLPAEDAVPVAWLRKVLAEANEFPISERETIVAIPYLIKRWQKEQEART